MVPQGLFHSRKEFIDELDFAFKYELGKVDA